MKYRLFDGGYESFLDRRVPEEYKNIVVDQLPQEIIDAETEAFKPKKSLQEEIEILKERFNKLVHRLGTDV